MFPFHLAFKVKDIASTRAFYVDILGCKEGRSTTHWIDFDFFGHQLSAHVSEHFPPLDYCGQVDGIKVPTPHFGVLLPVATFQQIQHRLIEENVSFIVEPYLRYANKKGEQWTMFFLDYSNNPIELKAFTNPEDIFST